MESHGERLDHLRKVPHLNRNWKVAVLFLFAVVGYVVFSSTYTTTPLPSSSRQRFSASTPRLGNLRKEPSASLPSTTTASPSVVASQPLATSIGSMIAPNSCSIVSLLTTSNEYAMGAIVLGHSIKRLVIDPQRERRANGQPVSSVDMDVTMNLLIVNQVNENTRTELRSVGWNLIEVSGIPAPQGCERDQHPYLLTKLHMWNPNVLPYERVIYLDLDDLVIQDISHLCSLEPRNKLHVRQDVARKRAVPGKFNSGVMVIQPDLALYDKMHQSIGRWCFDARTGRISGAQGVKVIGDQSFLNWFWRTRLNSDWKWLPVGYNFYELTAMRNMTGLWPDDWSDKDLYIMHYTARDKPWHRLWETTAKLHAYKRHYWEIEKNLTLADPKYTPIHPDNFRLRIPIPRNSNPKYIARQKMKKAMELVQGQKSDGGLGTFAQYFAAAAAAHTAQNMRRQKNVHKPYTKQFTSNNNDNKNMQPPTGWGPPPNLRGHTG